jgi:2-amino-4-hydroxy-6-hydroxymethyldihydropteridine diphosphokinase
MSTVYVGIGSNLGDRQINCEHAIELLQSCGVIVTKRSSQHETAPWGVKDQPPFLNMAIEIKTDLFPAELLTLLKDIERRIGRVQTIRWGPRIIDLDILLFDDIILENENLKIPHPLLHMRDFILKPLHEIAPNIQHPVLKETIHTLLQKLSGQPH